MSRHALTRPDRPLPAVIQLRDGTCKYVKAQTEGRHHRGLRLGMQVHRQRHVVVFHPVAFLRLRPAPMKMIGEKRTHPIWVAKIAPRKAVR